MRSSMMALAALGLLSGCAGTRMPKLAKCAGPYRYANIYGTVLPTLPIPGQPPASAPPSTDGAAKPPPAAPGAGVAPAIPSRSPTAPTQSPPSAPAKTSALQPVYPSC